MFLLVAELHTAESLSNGACLIPQFIGDLLIGGFLGLEQKRYDALSLFI